MRDRLTTLYVISRVIGRGSPGLVWGILTVCYSIGIASHDVNLSSFLLLTHHTAGDSCSRPRCCETDRDCYSQCEGFGCQRQSS